MNPVVFHTQPPYLQQTDTSKQNTSKQECTPNKLPSDVFSDSINKNDLSSNKKKRCLEGGVEQSPSRRICLVSNNSSNNSSQSSPVVQTAIAKTNRTLSKVSEEFGSVGNLLRGGKKVPSDYLPAKKLEFSPNSTETQKGSESPKAMSEDSDDDLSFLLSPFLFCNDKAEEKRIIAEKEKNHYKVDSSHSNTYDSEYNFPRDEQLIINEENSTSESDSKVESEDQLSESDAELSEDDLEPFTIKRALINLDIAEKRPLPNINKRPAIRSCDIEIEGLVDEEQPRLFKLNNEYYYIKLLSKGNNHYVYEFLNSEKMNGKVLKFPLHIKGSSIPKINSDAEASYKKMQEKKVRLPVVHAMPSTFVDSDNTENGGFWLLEKMKEEVSSNWPQGATMQTLSSKEKEVVDFVKSLLTSSAELRQEIVNDFYPRNVMRNEQDQLCIVDFSSEYQGEESDFENNMFGYLLAWSNRNEHIWQYLISDFPKDVADCMTEKLNTKKAEIGGAFPASRQLKV